MYKAGMTNENNVWRRLRTQKSTNIEELDLSEAELQDLENFLEELIFNVLFSFFSCLFHSHSLNLKLKTNLHLANW